MAELAANGTVRPAVVTAVPTATTTRPALATYLEQVSKIIVEQQGDIENGGVLAVVLNADPLIGSSAPQEDGADDVQHILLQHDAAAPVDVGIGEVDRQ